MQIKEIIHNIPFIKSIGNENASINALVFDSRKTIENSAYIAIKGTIADGHLYINSAIEKGAKMIVCEVLPEEIILGVFYFLVKDSAVVLGNLASNFFGNPSSQLQLVGITGTNGKTSATTLLYDVFTNLGFSCALISTVEYRIADEIIPSTHTTPDIIRINEILAKAVAKGTAKSIFTPNLKMAGKTGTARFEYWLPGPRKYRASFAGFYPADKPKYTCYVMVSEPDVAKGFYGGAVAAPVFKEIAGKTFLKTPQNVEKEVLVDRKVDLSKMVEPNKKVSIENKTMPNLIGLIGKNTIPQIENQGYRIDYKGVGRIIEQFPAEGTLINKNQRIYLRLQN
jgi:cell division protein FtsI (penicillin-binding protein 3)